MAYVSLKDIALRAGVSTAAVSMALRNQPGVSAERAQSIQKLAREMGYQTPALLHEAMSQLRGRKPERFHSELALFLDVYPEQWKASPPPYWRRMEEAAEAMGYRLLKVFRPSNSPSTLKRMLRARNVKGILLELQNRLTADLEFLLHDHTAVLIGPARRFNMLSHFVDVDRFQAGQTAVLEALHHGYTRIAYLGISYLDIDGRCLAGALASMPSFLDLAFLRIDRFDDEAKLIFQKWFLKTKPDCLVTAVSEVRDWLREIGIEAPRDIGLIHTNRSFPVPPDWSGVDTRDDAVHLAGLNKLVSLLRRGEKGIPEIQQGTLVEGVWAEGSTLCPLKEKLVWGKQASPLPTFPQGPGRVRFVDLKPFINQSSSGSGGWFGALPLEYCPAGEHEVCGTSFRILDEKKLGRNVLILRSRRSSEEADFPVRVEIPIRQKVRAVHFLHACGWSSGKVRNFASYQLVDDTGKMHRILLRDRRQGEEPDPGDNLQDYWPRVPGLTARQVRPVQLTAYGNDLIYSAHLYVLQWVNPRPEKAIHSLWVESDPQAETTLALLAVSLRV